MFYLFKSWATYYLISGHPSDYLQAVNQFKKIYGIDDNLLISLIRKNEKIKDLLDGIDLNFNSLDLKWPGIICLKCDRHYCYIPGIVGSYLYTCGLCL